MPICIRLLSIGQGTDFDRRKKCGLNFKIEIKKLYWEESKAEKKTFKGG